MDSTYKLIELIGTSSTSYEEAIKTAVDDAKKTLHD
ncbi:MAG: dodecin family protein, partial [Thermodesulfobacteriota bacterium]